MNRLPLAYKEKWSCAKNISRNCFLRHEHSHSVPQALGYISNQNFSLCPNQKMSFSKISKMSLQNGFPWSAVEGNLIPFSPDWELWCPIIESLLPSDPYRVNVTFQRGTLNNTHHYILFKSVNHKSVHTSNDDISFHRHAAKQMFHIWKSILLRGLELFKHIHCVFFLLYFTLKAYFTLLHSANLHKVLK